MLKTTEYNLSSVIIHIMFPENIHNKVYNAIMTALNKNCSKTLVNGTHINQSDRTFYMR